MTITEFLLEQIAEDEAWANAAVQTPGATHWHWVDPETDAPLSPDPFTQEAVNDAEGASLRTVEELCPPVWEGGSSLPDFVIWRTDETSAGAAGHIARHDPARVLAQCEAHRKIVELHTDSFGDCGGCSRFEYPCPTLRAVASIYRDRPGWREDWA